MCIRNERAVRLLLLAGDNPIHDVRLFVFETAWVALGVALLRAEPSRGRETAAVPA